jgi:hypothetical protein
VDLVTLCVVISNIGPDAVGSIDFQVTASPVKTALMWYHLITLERILVAIILSRAEITGCFERRIGFWFWQTAIDTGTA